MIVLEQVDNGRGRQREIAFADTRRREGSGQVQLQTHLEAALRSAALPLFKAGQVQEQEFLRQDEVLLDNTVAGK